MSSAAIPNTVRTPSSSSNRRPREGKEPSLPPPLSLQQQQAAAPSAPARNGAPRKGPMAPSHNNNSSARAQRNGHAAPSHGPVRSVIRRNPAKSPAVETNRTTTAAKAGDPPASASEGGSAKATGVQHHRRTGRQSLNRAPAPQHRSVSAHATTLPSEGAVPQPLEAPPPLEESAVVVPYHEDEDSGKEEEREDAASQPRSTPPPPPIPLTGILSGETSATTESNSRRNTWHVRRPVSQWDREAHPSGSAMANEERSASGGTRRVSISGNAYPISPSALHQRRHSRAGSSVSGALTSPSRRQRRHSRAGSSASGAFPNSPSRRPSIASSILAANAIFGPPPPKPESPAASARKIKREILSRHADEESVLSEDNEANTFQYEPPTSARSRSEAEPTSRRSSLGRRSSPTRQLELVAPSSAHASARRRRSIASADHTSQRHFAPSLLPAKSAAADGRKGTEVGEVEEEYVPAPALRVTPMAHPAPLTVENVTTAIPVDARVIEASISAASAPFVPMTAVSTGDYTTEAAARDDVAPINEEDPPGFYPPLYIQRALLCIEHLKKHRCFNFIDAGCSDGGLLQYVIKSQLIENSFRNVVGIDMSPDALRLTEASLPTPASSNAEYLHRVRVELVLGDLTLPPPLVLLGSQRAPPYVANAEDVDGSVGDANRKDESAVGRIYAQRRPWLQMDRYYIKQRMNQKLKEEIADAVKESQSGKRHGSTPGGADLGERSVRRRSGGESMLELSSNDVSATFDDGPDTNGVHEGAQTTPSTARGRRTSSVDPVRAIYTAKTPQQQMDAVISIEVMEHIPPHLVAAYADTLFAQLSASRGAKVVILTTPNRAENDRFDTKDNNSRHPLGDGNANDATNAAIPQRSVYSPTTGQPKRRHPEHLFELTPPQFKAFCDYVLAVFQPYWDAYELVSLGDNFTQGAVFTSSAACAAREGGAATAPAQGVNRTRDAPSTVPVPPALALSSLPRASASPGYPTGRRSVGTARGQTASLGQWNMDDSRPSMELAAGTARGNTARDMEDGELPAPKKAREVAVADTITALRRGRSVDASLKRRVARKAAQATGAGTPRTARATSAPATARGSRRPSRAASSRHRQPSKKRASAAAAGKRSGATTPRQPSTADRKTPRRSVTPARTTDANASVSPQPRRPSANPGAHRFDPGFAGGLAGSLGAAAERREQTQESPAAGTARVSAAREPFTWHYTREERLQAFPFEDIFGMPEATYRAEFSDAIRATDVARVARALGVDEAYAAVANAGRRSGKRPHISHGYVSMHRVVIPATSLWDRLCDAVFSSAQHLYDDMLSACFVGRRGSIGGSSAGWRSSASAAAPAAGTLTREGLLFGELVLRRERTTAFKPLRCSVCAMLAMLEEQRALWHKNAMADLRRWYTFARAHLLDPNSPFTMLPDRTAKILPATRRVSAAVAHRWARSLPADSVAIPNSAAYTALKGRSPAEQREGGTLLKDLRLSQSGLRVHTWLQEEISRLAVLHARRAAARPRDASMGNGSAMDEESVSYESPARAASPTAAATTSTRSVSDILNDDQTRVEEFLPDDVALVLFFMAAVDALPKASAWMRERVPRWNPVTTGNSSSAVGTGNDSGAAVSTNVGTSTDVLLTARRRSSIAPVGDFATTADIDDAAEAMGMQSVSRRRRLSHVMEASPQRATASSPRRTVEIVAGAAVGAYSVGGSSGLTGVAPSSGAVLLLASSLSTFRVDASVLEYLLGLPEDYVTVEY